MHRTTACLQIVLDLTLFEIELKNFVNVECLRRKLGAEGAHSCIETHDGLETKLSSTCSSKVDYAKKKQKAMGCM